MSLDVIVCCGTLQYTTNVTQCVLVYNIPTLHGALSQAIGAGSINVAVKGLAIARKNVEEEAIDLLCKPEFTEV